MADLLLLETGGTDNLLLESGDNLLLESSTAATTLTGLGDLGHGHTVDAVSLTQQHNLTVGDLAHSHTADTVTLTQTHALTVNGLEHASTIDAVALTQIHALATVDLEHAHTIGDITFDTGRLLQIAAAALVAHWRTTDLTSDHDADPLVAHWSATTLQESP